MASFVEIWLRTTLDQTPIGTRQSILEEITKSTEGDIIKEDLLLSRLEELAEHAMKVEECYDEAG